MRYPAYAAQPFTGNLQTVYQDGPPDLRPTSSTAPIYQAPIDARYGRMLAGDIAVQDEQAHPDNAWAVNELALAREMDDVQGDGIFDPPGTHPNIHPDAGVFAARFSLPGYHAREVMFQRSEVRDATTGRPIIPVPSGAVSLDTPAKLAQLERNLYAPAQPVVWSNRGGRVRDESIVNWAQNPQAVQGMGRWGMGEDAPPAVPAGSAARLATAVVVIGLTAGALYALSKKKGRR